MITDAQLMFTPDAGQAVTTSAASANQIDTLAARDMERGAMPARFVAYVMEDFADGTSLKVQVRQSAAANMGSPDVIGEGPVVAVANLKAGAKLLDMPMPSRDAFGDKRYLDMNFVAVGTHTAGKVWAGIVLNSAGGEEQLGNTGL